MFVPSAKAEPEFPLTPEERAEFKRLDRIVQRGIAAFMEAGGALRKIHDGKLWRAGGYATWEGYCRVVAGISKSYAHRLMQTSEIAHELSKSLPIGNDSSHLNPVFEAQIRPLIQLKEPDKRVEAWKSAVEKAEGGSPTAVEVTEAVFEILNPDGLAEKPESRSERRVNVVNRLKDAIQRRASWDQLDELLQKLEDLL